MLKSSWLCFCHGHTVKKSNNDSCYEVWNKINCAQEISCSVLQPTNTTVASTRKHDKALAENANTIAAMIAQWWWWACSTVWANLSVSTKCSRRLGMHQFCWRRGSYCIHRFSTSHVKHRLPLARWWLNTKPTVSPQLTTSVWTLMLIFYYVSRANKKKTIDVLTIPWTV